uniref:Uncharacterized protein n=1 Tax=Tetradesmus obliquus TaxID=3088 RepID=A0A383VLX7_TETOB|eukprot:jgi/Sobl393_1/14120/SZX65742.1
MKSTVRWTLFFALLISLSVAVLGARTRPMLVISAPGRKTLADSNNLFPQYKWDYGRGSNTLCTGTTQLQQPLLDDAWKHLQEDMNPGTKIKIQCDEQNPAMCPNRK